MADTPTLEKPPFGSPCNGCGVCCTRSPCSTSEKLGLDFDPDKGGCSGKKLVEGVWRCGPLLAEQAMHEETGSVVIIPQALGSGHGCDCFIQSYGPDLDLTMRCVLNHKKQQEVTEADSMGYFRQIFEVPTGAPTFLEHLVIATQVSEHLSALRKYMDQKGWLA